MNLKFDLADIQAFAAVAELRSFRAAAESINLSQPAFSRRIDKLEEALGVRLLDRTTRRVTLTAVGRDFAHKAHAWLGDLDDMLLGLGDIASQRLGEVTIACVPSAAYYFLPQVLKHYRERFPRIRVKVHDAGANEVLVAVAQGDADFGLNFIGSQEAEIEFRRVLTERFVVACRRDHPLARRRQVSWADLRKYPYLSVSKASGNRLLLDLAVARTESPKEASAQASAHAVYEAQHVTTVLGLVEADLGVAVVPGLAMPAKDHPVLASVPLADPVVTRQIGLIKRRGRSLSPAAQPLYQMLADFKPGRKRPASTE